MLKIKGERKPFQRKKTRGSGALSMPGTPQSRFNDFG